MLSDPDCSTGPERRNRCLEEGHLLKDCTSKKFINSLAYMKIENLEKDSPILEPQEGESNMSAQTPAQDSNAIEHDNAAIDQDEISDAAGQNESGKSGREHRQSSVSINTGS